jgi:peptidoglycan-N-acetylglucosamine deacetylase
MWTCDSLGWNGASVDRIVERCGSEADAGDIILMHVGAESLDGEALPHLIETLEEAGFDLVTVEELLQP